MIFSMQALGVTQAARRFNRMGAAAISIAPAWRRILEYFFYIEDATFTSQGRRGGGSWAEDTPGWLAQKARLNWDPRINFATHALYNAMTLPGAPGQVVKIEPHTLIFGSDLPEAAPSQKHRPFIKLTATDRLEMSHLIASYFKRAWEAAA